MGLVGGPGGTLVRASHAPQRPGLQGLSHRIVQGDGEVGGALDSQGLGVDRVSHTDQAPQIEPGHSQPAFFDQQVNLSSGSLGVQLQ